VLACVARETARKALDVYRFLRDQAIEFIQFSPVVGGSSLVLEHNGDIFACDHCVYPEYRLGNILDDALPVRRVHFRPEGTLRRCVGSRCKVY
jgi:sulfatase maturation enzyme AslB (radical SAM superfamily)